MRSAGLQACRQAGLKPRTTNALVPLQKGRELAIVGKFMSEPSRDVGCGRHVTLSDLHVPQRKLGFDMAEEVRLDLCSFTNVGKGLLPIAAAQQPAGAPWHFRVDDVVDPRARDACANVPRILSEHRVEGPSRFPGTRPNRSFGAAVRAEARRSSDPACRGRTAPLRRRRSIGASCGPCSARGGRQRGTRR